MQKQYALLAKRIAFLLLVYCLIRLLFLAFNWPTFQQFDKFTILTSFLIGVKFDAAAISIINLLLIVFSLIPHHSINKKWYQNGLITLFWGLNIPFILLNIVDFEFFKFIGRRTNYSILGIATDIGQQSASLLLKYWYLAIIFLFFALLFWIFNKKNKIQTSEFPIIKKLHFLWPILIIGFAIIVFRGGLQTKPLRISDAFAQNSNVLGNLVLNTSFTFIKTSTVKGINKVFNFKEAELKKHLPKVVFANNFEHKIKPNVVIIIVESLSKEYLGNPVEGSGYSPFLDSLAKISLSMTNHFANGRESIDAMPAITASIPKLMDNAFITSQYQSNKVVGLAEILTKNGYNTSFYHGARNGSMGFEAFSHMVGYQSYNGLNEYIKDCPKANDFDGTWGIFDEPYLQYFSENLKKTKQPFFSTIFTLSSHVPYTIPKKYIGKFPKGKLPIHESMGYADNALRQFFQKSKNEDWFKNTLFIITGDHTQQSINAEYQSEMGAYNVPLILYHSNNEILSKIKSTIDKDRVCQHTDIMPTVLDFLALGDQTILLPFGQSVFVKNCNGFALNYTPGVFRYYKANYYVENQAGKFSFKGNYKHNFEGCLIKTNNLQLENEFKALIQYYYNGLVENSWYK